MEKQRMHTLRMVMLAMMVAIGVVISPILRIEGMCPTAHLVNIVCSVLMGPWYSLLCATMIGVIRMKKIGIPPLALTGAVFGAFLSGVYNWTLCFLSGYGIPHGNRPTNSILFYADVPCSNHNGRMCCLYFPEGSE